MSKKIQIDCLAKHLYATRLVESEDQGREIIRELFGKIAKETMENNNEVYIYRFGTFYQMFKKANQGAMNFAEGRLFTKEESESMGSLALRFKCSGNLKIKKTKQ